MEVIRGWERDCGLEIRGEAERRGARSARSFVHAGQSRAQLLTRARILLSSAALETSINNIGRLRRQLVEEGFEATLSRKYNPNSARPRIFDGRAEAKLIALTCSDWLFW